MNQPIIPATTTFVLSTFGECKAVSHAHHSSEVVEVRAQLSYRLFVRLAVCGQLVFDHRHPCFCDKPLVFVSQAPRRVQPFHKPRVLCKAGGRHRGVVPSTAAEELQEAVAKLPARRVPKKLCQRTVRGDPGLVQHARCPRIVPVAAKLVRKLGGHELCPLCCVGRAAYQSAAGTFWACHAEEP